MKPVDLVKKLSSFGIKPKKSMGQNFLMDKNMAKKICSAVPFEEDFVIVEIGPGTGALSFFLAERKNDLILIEKDADLASYLEKVFGGRAKVISGDFLKLEPKEIFGITEKKAVFIGNLPYYVSKRILRRTFELKDKLRACVFTLQREVAEKLTASPSSPDYGILSVLFGYCSESKIVARQSPDCFYPKPGVDSATVRITFKKNCACTGKFSEKEFESLVKCSFRQRRKILFNNLKGFYDIEGIEGLQELLRRRAQELSPGEFVLISERIKRK